MKITDLADATNDKDALNRQTANTLYEPIITGLTLTNNGIDFSNDSSVIIE